MEAKKIYIGEVYVNDKKSNEPKRIGFKIIHHNEDSNAYFYLNNNQEYSISTDRSTHYQYLEKESLIPFSSFAKMSENPSGFEIIYRCNLQIRKMISERCKKIYGYDYTDDEIDEIHERGKLTIDEKADQIFRFHLCTRDQLKNNLCKCEVYENCLECIYASLRETNLKEFDEFGISSDKKLDYQFNCTNGGVNNG